MIRTVFPVLCSCAMLLASCAGGPGPAGAVTGLILDARAPAGERVVADPPREWTIVDEGRVEVFSSRDLSPRNGRHGFYYQPRYERARAAELLPWIGRNPLEVRVRKTEWASDLTTAVFVLDQATADGLRAIPDLHDLVRRANLEIVLGAGGQ